MPASSNMIGISCYLFWNFVIFYLDLLCICLSFIIELLIFETFLNQFLYLYCRQHQQTGELANW